VPDVQTVWVADLNSAGDWALAGPDLASGDDLASAVLISLFTDARAAADDVIPDGSGDPRGWWADGDPEGPIGSKLWLRLRSKITQDTLNLVKGDIAQALAWLIEDQVASRVTVMTEWTTPTLLGASVVIDQGDQVSQLGFTFAWAPQAAAAIPTYVGKLDFTDRRNAILRNLGL
jgi:phage gp46-like protein